MDDSIKLFMNVVRRGKDMGDIEIEGDMVVDEEGMMRHKDMEVAAINGMILGLLSVNAGIGVRTTQTLHIINLINVLDHFIHQGDIPREVGRGRQNEEGVHLFLVVHPSLQEMLHPAQGIPCQELVKNPLP